MEDLIFSSPYIKAYFNQEKKIYTSEYLPETENMTDKQWKVLMKDLANTIEKYNPYYIIDDNRERRYAYSPDMQAWTLSLFTASWNKIGLKKYAQIIPKEIIGKLTTQQIEEQANKEFDMHYEVKIVNDYESALYWIEE